MIDVVGIGPGQLAFYTQAALDVLEKATMIIGYERQLESLPKVSGKKKIITGSFSELVTWIKLSEDSEHIVVLASGDPTFYGIGKYLSEQLGHDNVRIISGISSVQYLFAQLKLSMNDCFLTSSHGREPDFSFIFQHDKIAMVTDEKVGPYQIAAEILARGTGHQIIVGENLSYPNEKIYRYAPIDVPDRAYSINVVVLINER